MSTWPDASGAHSPETTAYADTLDASEGAHEKAERASLGELVGDISQGLSTLLRQEVELAKAEARESATRAGKAAGIFSGAALAGWMTLLFLSLAVWEWLSSAMESRGWAAIVVMAVWGIAAAILTMVGRRTTKQIQGLPRTTETAKRVPDALMGNEEAR
ncbi:phage holin family protein [Terracoccus sp. 273MFTsu3.1]|uniref:phage holin family protein n=1 Tax=Terracoccus sp. 273MFTsu3.1 TaxID=1172188 RepID=UPI00036E2468|nr:phage holin family protein [Terracoccus sp. 273MFTsu3.1]